MKMKKIKAAVVGCGSVAMLSHLPSLISLKDKVRVVGVSDADLGKAESASKRFGVKGCYSSWEKMIEREEPDLVHVCTPPDTHAQISVGALESGCHVMVEKPMALNLRECDEMIEAASRSGRALCVSHNQRFHPCFQRARRIIGSGELGKVIEVRITHQMRNSVYFNPSHWVHHIEGGLIFDIFPHPIYLSLPIIGSADSLGAKAFKTDSAHELPYDTILATIEGKSCSCRILVRFGGGSWNYTLEAIGTEGALQLDFYNSLILTSLLPSLKIIDKNLLSISRWAQLTRQSISNALRPSSMRWLQTHKSLIREFVDSIIETGGNPPVPPEEGRETVRIASEICRMLEKA